MGKIMTLEEIKAVSVEDLLLEVDRSQENVRVVLEHGHEIEIKPVPQRKQLITFEGLVPDGWKDAIYAPER